MSNNFLRGTNGFKFSLDILKCIGTVAFGIWAFKKIKKAISNRKNSN